MSCNRKTGSVDVKELKFSINCFSKAHLNRGVLKMSNKYSNLKVSLNLFKDEFSIEIVKLVGERVIRRERNVSLL